MAGKVRKRRGSIRRRLSYSFMGIIIISVSIFVFMVSLFLKQYYYNSLEDVLGNQIHMSANFYSKYFSDSTLTDNVMDNVDVFWRSTSAQVQIIDNSGVVLMDSIGVKHSDELDTADVKKALKGAMGRWIGRVDYTDEMVMSLAYPLEANHEIIGVLRFITSLEPINRQLREIIRVFVWIGVLTVVISGIISFILASGVVGPIKKVTAVAGEMAEGDLEARSTIVSNDEVGQLSDTLNYLASQVSEKERIKNEFLASVSHELRTPLTSIKGWAIILRDTDPHDEAVFRDGLRIIEKETERLSGMVEELLDFSKLISGNMSLKLKKVNVSGLMEYIKKHMSPVAKRSGIDFIVDYPEVLPDLYLDEDRIKQVLINILDNAFKYTDQGGWVKFQTREDGETLVMEVEDNGRGIPGAELPRVKEKFYKGRNSKASSGIGLSIADEIVERHGGSLVIESRENKGTKVMVILPIDKGH